MSVTQPDSTGSSRFLKQEARDEKAGEAEEHSHAGCREGSVPLPAFGAERKQVSQNYQRYADSAPSIEHGEVRHFSDGLRHKLRALTPRVALRRLSLERFFSRCIRSGFVLVAFR